MSSTELATAALGFARDELVVRVRLRDQLLLVYLGFVGVALGWQLTSSAAELTRILMVLPFLALGIEILQSQHYRHIGLLAQFCATHPSVLPVKGEEHFSVLFDQWLALHEEALRSTLLRFLGTLIIIGLPALVALIWHWKDALGAAPWSWLWFAAFVSFGATLSIAIWSFFARRRLFDTTKGYLTRCGVKRPLLNAS